MNKIMGAGIVAAFGGLALFVAAAVGGTPPAQAGIATPTAETIIRSATPKISATPAVTSTVMPTAAPTMAPAPTQPAAAPTSPGGAAGGAITGPSTGTGGATGSGQMFWWLIAGGIVLVLAGGSGVAYGARHRR